jgi:hypothetical protein
MAVMDDKTAASETANLSSSVVESTGPIHRLEAQFSGKEHLKPIYERVIDLVSEFAGGFDVVIKRNYVSLRRRRQFAILKPSTRTRLDLGLALRGVEPVGRLELAEKFSSMVSHRVRLSSIDSVDDEVRLWLRLAHHLS